MDQDDTPTTDNAPRNWAARDKLVRISTEIEQLTAGLAPSPGTCADQRDESELDFERWDGLS